MSTMAAETAYTPLEAEFMVDSNQKFWDKAVDLFKKGKSSREAIRTIWGIMPPPGELSVLATIIGAIYADTYWEKTKFSVQSLAGDLQAVTGHDARAAADAAFKSWHGLLVRSSWHDYGSIPRSSDVTKSPDVVLNALSPLDVQQIIRQWNTDIYTPAMGKNYTYGRAQSLNMPVSIEEPKLRMYHSDAGFNPPPTTWKQLLTFDEANDTSPMKVANGSTTVRPTTRCASSEAFDLDLQRSGHFCLITVAATEFFTNNPVAGSSNWDTNEWITNNGGAGWHNIDRTTSNRESLKFYNQDPRPERFAFEAHCTRVPVGTKVSLECSDAGLAYPLDTGEVTITDPEYQVVRTEAELPPNFEGTLQVKYQTPRGGLLPEGSALDVHMKWIIPHGHEHYHDAARRLNDVGGTILSHPMTIEIGNYVLLGAV